MSLYKHVRNLWKKPKKNLGELWQKRLILWRKELATVRLARPTRIDRARSLGYKAKQGFVVVRQRVKRGGHTRADDFRGRRPKHAGMKKNLDMNYRHIAEQRAAKKYPNLEVLNSYYVAHDGKHYWYEIIFVDKEHPVIKSDKSINWICDSANRRRVFRGKTSAARKSNKRLTQRKGRS